MPRIGPLTSAFYGADVAAALTAETIRTAPKVLLHDHLDGGPRVSTVIELAAAAGYRGLPTTDPTELAARFLAGGSGGRRSGSTAHSASLERYLETFGHTVAVMQTPEALARVASEAVQDLAAAGVVYAEIRVAPELHVERGLDLDTVVRSVLSGLRAGTGLAAAEGRRIRVGCLLTAMRHAARSREIAELSVRHRDAGVVGFDIAGAEKGHPPTRHRDAFEYVRRNDAHITIHAGEAFGLPSIREAVQSCGADRLGHGVRIVDDIAVGPDPREPPRPGRLAAYVRDMRVPLELCPTSNVHTGAAPSLAEPPIGLLTRLRFRVTVNTDNRLMSGCTMTSEMTDLVQTFGYGWSTLRWFTVNAMKSAFLGFDERLALIEDVIEPGYAALTADRGGPHGGAGPG